MLPIRYYKADSATYVIKSAGDKVCKQGKGLSFFYNSAITSIAAIPVNVQEAPFIFTLQTSDFQEVRVQGQISFRVSDPQATASLLNFNLKSDAQSYASEDPMKLSDRVVRAAQTIVQNTVQGATLRESLTLNRDLAELLKNQLSDASMFQELGLTLVDAAVSNIIASPETRKALEAKARETMLKEADDAIYARRKSAVEQERTIKDAELETELAVQQKEQEIAESDLSNKRSLMLSRAETQKEQINSEIEAERQRNELVTLSVENKKQEADSEAYALAARMKALAELPVENLKAMAMTQMQPEQLMALSFETLAQNADKIGELNIGPDIFQQAIKKAVDA